jgi:hypothetical protein
MWQPGRAVFGGICRFMAKLSGKLFVSAEGARRAMRRSLAAGSMQHCCQG